MSNLRDLINYSVLTTRNSAVDSVMAAAQVVRKQIRHANISILRAEASQLIPVFEYNSTAGEKAADVVGRPIELDAHSSVAGASYCAFRGSLIHLSNAYRDAHLIDARYNPVYDKLMGIKATTVLTGVMSDRILQVYGDCFSETEVETVGELVRISCLQELIEMGESGIVGISEGPQAFKKIANILNAALGANRCDYFSLDDDRVLHLAYSRAVSPSHAIPNTTFPFFNIDLTRDVLPVTHCVVSKGAFSTTRLVIPQYKWEMIYPRDCAVIALPVIESDGSIKGVFQSIFLADNLKDEFRSIIRRPGTNGDLTPLSFVEQVGLADHFTAPVFRHFGAILDNAQDQTSLTSISKEKKAIRPGKNLSASVEAGDYVFLSGKTGIGSDDHPIKGITAQTEHIMEQHKSTLAESGLKMSDVVKATVFIRSSEDFAAMNETYHRYFPNDPPARTTVVTGFPGPRVLVEIEMIAYRGSRGK